MAAAQWALAQLPALVPVLALVLALALAVQARPQTEVVGAVKLGVVWAVKSASRSGKDLELQA